jgi:two-component system response regulator AtoC
VTNKDKEKKHILVADDDTQIRNLLAELFIEVGYEVTTAKNGAEVLERVKNLSSNLDLVFMDVRMPDTDGLTVLKQIQSDTKTTIPLPVIIMTAFSSSNIAIKAMQIGAEDYITKPFADLEDVLTRVAKVFERQALITEIREMRTPQGRDPSEKIIGDSTAMQEIYKLIGRVAGSDATVLVTGETGTGKELIANILHANSKYSHGPLIKVNCAALPETLLESELFGHEAGAFTGAVKQHKGRFEMANKGTIFLDEVGEMTLGTQKKLLRVLQEREFERVGGSLPVKVDVRVIAATNRDLQQEVDAGNFRADLFFRLNVISIHMPPLRERLGDIPLLVEYFLDKNRFSPASPPTRISEEAMQLLENYNWPGNVRQLENTIEKAVIYARGGIVTSEHLLLPDKNSKASASEDTFYVEKLVKDKVGLKEALALLERNMLAEALRQTSSEAAAASLLNLEADELKFKIKQYKLG